MLLKKIALGVYFFFYLGYFCSPIFADTVVLKSGQVVDGKIIENTGKYVKIDFDGVKVTYFQEEIVSINQGRADNTVSKELISPYEAFKSSKKVVNNKNLPVEPVEPVQPTVNQEAQDAVNVSALSLPQSAGSANPLTTAQAALSQLPKEYQEMIKSKLQNMQDSSGADQVPGAAGVDLSSLPPEYQNMVKSSLEKLQPNTQETKN